MRQELEAAGRVWLLLPHLDGDGRGWVDAADARRALATKGSKLRVCG